MVFPFPKTLRFLVACTLFSCALLGYFVFDRYIQHTEGTDFVAFLDVGQGDAIFIETKEGFQVLVDTGRGNKVLHGLSDVMDIQDRSIDMVVITHPDADHIGGLVSVLRSFDVSYLLLPDSDDVHTNERVADAVAEESLQVLVPDVPSRIQLSPDVSMDILWGIDTDLIPEKNARSVVLKVQGSKKSFLLTGDVPSSVEREMVTIYGDALDVDVLKLSHHGSKTSSDALFLKAVKPEAVIVSAGLNNRYNHPHPDVLERVRTLFPSTEIYHTGESSPVFDL